MADKPKASASKTLKNLDGKMAVPVSFFFIIKEVVVVQKKKEKKKRGEEGWAGRKQKRGGSFEATLPKSIYSITNPPLGLGSKDSGTLHVSFK